jgi:hypothetical protein
MGAGLAVGLLEVLLHLLPVAGRGVHAAEYDPAWPINHLLPNSRYTYSAGWKLDLAHEGAVNDMGYVAPFDYAQSAGGGVAVLGDSYIESLMNDYGDTLQGRLPAMLEGRVPVLQFGSSGASMPDYLVIARLVADRFHPAWGIVLITEMDFVEGFAPARGNYGWNKDQDVPVRLNQPPAQRGFIARWGRRLSLFQYIRNNLKVQPAAMIALHPAPGAGAQPAMACKSSGLEPGDEALVAAFAEQLPRQFGLAPDHVVVVFDSASERKAIYSGEAAVGGCETRDSAASRALRRYLASRGVNIVETHRLFTDYYRGTRHRLDHSPLDMHWNGEAHRLVAGQVAAIINARSLHEPALQSRDTAFTCSFSGAAPSSPACLRR